MNFQKLTLKSQEAVQTAQDIASNYNNQAIEPIHLFAALVQDSDGIIPEILMKLGANPNQIKINVNEEIEKLPKVAGLSGGGQYISPPTNNIFDIAFKEAKCNFFFIVF